VASGKDAEANTIYYGTDSYWWMPDSNPRSYDSEPPSGGSHLDCTRVMGPPPRLQATGRPQTDCWLSHKRWYAVLHTFDVAGHHLESRIQHTGTNDQHGWPSDASCRDI
jgi:formate hydrogenlyase regulatory protein HycA